MSLLGQKLTEFIAQEQLVGISLQQFKQKFVFNSNSGPDAIFIDITQPSPSQILGLTKIQQNQCIILMVEIIFKAGEMLKLPVSTTIVAVNIAQYYFTRRTFLDYDFRDVAMGAMFLACKSEETLRRSYQIAAVFDYVFKMYEGIRAIRQLQLNSNEYSYMKQKVIKTENQILFQLGFEVFKLFDIPHRYISGLIASFNRHKSCNSIVQHSWTFLNDIYRTKAAVCFPGQVIAAASVFMSLQKLGISMPQKPWWILMEASVEQIRQICILTNQMYETSNKNAVNINKVSQILQKVGKEVLNISNILPVPYYRKIRLESQGLLMKPIEKQISKPRIEKEQNEGQSSQDQINHHQRSKKQKKKDKKKHKSHKREDRSNSRSLERNKKHKKGKYQNDEQTPKIKKQIPEIIIQQQGALIQETMRLNQKKPLQAQQQGTKIVKQEPQRKNSQLSITNGLKQQVVPVKKSVLLDAKSMLSKISLQIKKIEVKNQIATALHEKNEEASKNQKGSEQNKGANQQGDSEHNNHTEQGFQQGSDSDQQDELLAQLIKIKRKNLQKKEQKN